MQKLKVLFICSLFFVFSGFRLLNANVRWNISKEDPTIWVRIADDTFTYRFSSIDFQDGSRPLDNLNAEQEFQKVFEMIFADFNQVPGTYIKLNFHADNLLQASSDFSDKFVVQNFDEEKAKNRTITFSLSDTPGLSSGISKPVYEGSYYESCTINIKWADVKKAEYFKKVTTHEIAHCLGLDHMHEDSDSILSYNAKKGQHALSADDKMGVAFLYPRDPKKMREDPTFGMSCTPR